MLTQYERSESKFERRDEKIAGLIRSLEEETRNMVPWRHYGAMLNLVKELQRIMVRARDALPKTNHEEIREITNALDIVEMHFSEGRIGDVKFINNENEGFTISPELKKRVSALIKRRGRPRKDKRKK